MLGLETAAASTSSLALALCLSHLVTAGFMLPGGEPVRLRRSLIAAATATLLLFLLLSVLTLLLVGSRLGGGLPTLDLMWRYLTRTQSGQIWLAREGYGVLLATFIVLFARRDPDRQLLRVTALLALPLVASRSLTSHAVTVREGTALVVAADAVHLIATALWGGGLIVLWRCLRFAKSQDGNAMSLRKIVVERFSLMAMVSVPIVFLTGLYQSWIHIGDFAALATTDYGKVLAVKLALFAVMLAIGAFNSLATKPLLARAGAKTARLAGRKAARRIGAESLFGIAIFGVTGLLTLLPPGVHALHQTISESASAAPQALQPAEGASVRILSPRPEQIFTSDRVPLKFELTKGERGHHVHAYVDGQLVGMFESEQGTLNGIAPGLHVLELRVVTADHQTELAAQDHVEFLVK